MILQVSQIPKPTTDLAESLYYLEKPNNSLTSEVFLFFGKSCCGQVSRYTLEYDKAFRSLLLVYPLI